MEKYQLCELLELETSEIDEAHCEWWYNEGKINKRVFKLMVMSDEKAVADDEAETKAREMNGGYAASFNAKNKLVLTELELLLEPIKAKGAYTQDNPEVQLLQEFARDEQVALKDMGISYDKQSPCKTIRSMLETLEYTVEGKRVRVGKEREHRYTVSQTALQKQRVQAMGLGESYF